MDVTSLKALNETFRSITQSNAISPDTVATLLNRIIEMLGTAKSESEVVNMLSDYVTKAGLSSSLSNYVTSTSLSSFFYNKGQVDSLLRNYLKQENLQAYTYNKGQIDNLLKPFVTQSGLQTYGYSKAQIDNLLKSFLKEENLQSFGYSKGQIDNLLKPFITQSGLQTYGYSKSQIDKLIASYALKSDLANHYTKNQVANLLTSYASLAQLKQLETKVSSLGSAGSGSSSGSSVGGSTAQISCFVEGGNLYVRGADELIKQGYIPYIFRYVRKHNRYRHEDEKSTYSPMRKGWQVFGDARRIKIDSSNQLFAKTPNDFYSPDAEDLIHKIVVREEHEDIYDDSSPVHSFVILYFGRKRYRFWRGQVRLRFAVAFSKPQPNERFDYSKLVTNFAEFRVCVECLAGAPEVRYGL